jgi:hypothetical protein
MSLISDSRMVRPGSRHTHQPWLARGRRRRANPVRATGEGQGIPWLLSLRHKARTICGSDARGYDAGGPDYPEEVYQILASRCGLRAGTSVVEIGPGPGLVTRRLGLSRSCTCHVPAVYLCW